MSASAILSSLPRDATSALASAGEFAQEKVIVRFKAVGNAPSLNREVCKISSSQKFEAVVSYLRRVLRVKDTDSVFLYVNSAFAPSLDEVVGNLHRVGFLYSTMDRLITLILRHQCFKNASDQLIITYSMTPAFG
jgi:ubiquitin-like protein ATG12